MTIESRLPNSFSEYCWSKIPERVTFHYMTHEARLIPHGRSGGQVRRWNSRHQFGSLWGWDDGEIVGWRTRAQAALAARKAEHSPSCNVHGIQVNYQFCSCGLDNV